MRSADYRDSVAQALEVDDYPAYPESPPLPPLERDVPDTSDIEYDATARAWVTTDEERYVAMPDVEYYNLNRQQRRAMARRNHRLNAFEYSQEYGTGLLSPFGESIVKEGKEVDVNSKSRNKRLAEWSISARALRYLVNRIVSQGEYPDSGDFMSAYKFGAYFAPRYRRWFIYNKATSNNIATVKLSNKRLIVRYRPNSFYSTVLSDMQVENVKTMAVESSNMHRHNRLLRGYEDEIQADKDGELQFRQLRKDRSDRKHNG